METVRDQFVGNPGLLTSCACCFFLIVLFDRIQVTFWEPPSNQHVPGCAWILQYSSFSSTRVCVDWDMIREVFVQCFSLPQSRPLDPLVSLIWPMSCKSPKRLTFYFQVLWAAICIMSDVRICWLAFLLDGRFWAHAPFFAKKLLTFRPDGPFLGSLPNS